MFSLSTASYSLQLVYLTMSCTELSSGLSVDSRFTTPNYKPYLTGRSANMTDKRQEKPIVWAIFQLCGIDRWTLFMPAIAMCVLSVFLLCALDWIKHWAYIPIMTIIICPIIIPLFRLEIAILFAGFFLLRSALLSHDVEAVPDSQALISDFLEKRECTRGYWKRQHLSFVFMREMAYTYGKWSIAVLTLMVILLFAQVTIHYVGVYQEHSGKEAARLKIEQYGYPYNLAFPEYGFGDPPESNRLTFPDYVKAALLLQPHEHKARSLLKRHARPLIDGYDGSDGSIPASSLHPRYVVIRQYDVDRISEHLPEDSPMSEFLRTLVSPSIERVPIPVKEVFWLSKVKNLLHLQRLVKVIGSDHIQKIEGKGACFMFYPWEVESIELLQAHYRDQEEEIKKTLIYPLGLEN